MSWQSVGTHTFVPTDKAVQVGSFNLAAGQDTIWVRITQLNSVDDWPWSYGILSWRNANGTPLGSVKAYSNRLGEVFRLGNGLPPSDGVGSIWFEPRGFNLGWLKAGFPWELSFEAQSGGEAVNSYWNRDPVNNSLSPSAAGDSVDLGTGNLTAANAFLNLNVDIGGPFVHADTDASRVGEGYAVLRRSSSSTAGAYLIRGFLGQSASGDGGNNRVFNVEADGSTQIGGTPAVPNIRLNNDGSAVFRGPISAPNVTFKSSDPSFQSKSGYSGPELDLLEEIIRLETLVRDLYVQLRLTPSAGWPVWDGNTDLTKSNIAKSRHI